VSTRVVLTNVTAAELTAAMGAGSTPDATLLWVEIPVRYCAGLVTAADIVHDPAIRLAHALDDEAPVTLRSR
jgi:hypothetical protein